MATLSRFYQVICFALGFCAALRIVCAPLAWSQAGEPAPSALSAATVVVTAFRRDDGSGNPGAAVAQFAPADHIQHFEVGVKGLSDPREAKPVLVRWDFQALETSVGPRDALASVEQLFPIPVAADEVLLQGKVSLARDWPIGRYRATLSVNNTPLRMLDYVVAPEPTPLPAPPAIKKFLMLSDNGKGQPGQQRAQFTPADHTIHFRADLNNRYTGKVRWKFTAVTTAAGNNVSLLDLQGSVVDVDYLVSQMAAPRDWPIGVYRVEVFINEALSHSHDFTISGMQGK